MADCLMGVDYGTGGAKACVIDAVGNVLGYAFREFPIVMEKPGWSEHDPGLYWDSTCQMIRETIAEARIDPREVRGISMSSAMPALVMVDEDHNPIGMAYNLMDRRATAEVQWLKDNVGEDRIFQVTGNRLEDHPTIVNLMWERNNRPELYAQIYKALNVDSYVRLKMTGRSVANYSTLALYGVAWDIVNNRFDEQLLEEIGINPRILPEPYPCGEVIGGVTAQAAAETGLYPGTPVTSGQIDCNAGWVGAGAIEEGDVQMNLGTVGNFGVIHKDTSFLKSMIVCAYTVDSAETYVTVPTTTTGGMSIRYLRDNFSQMEVEVERALGVDSYDLLNMQAAKVAPGSDGLVILPYLMGERTPIWDVDARGVIFGLSLSHTKGHIVRAMMEAVAYALYHNYTLIKDVRNKINYPFVLNEGGAKSPLWRRIITDVMNVPTVLVKRRTGAPYGDAILSGVATGVFKGFGVAREWAEYIDPMEPDQSNHERYMKYYAIYRNLYEHVKGDFQDLAVVRNKFA
jgi:sugar (pentulose or hexulose) kinase